MNVMHMINNIFQFLLCEFGQGHSVQIMFLQHNLQFQKKITYMPKLPDNT